MSSSRDPFDRFLLGVHRRLVWCRCIEGAGVGALIGALAALPLSLVLLMRGVSHVRPMFFMLVLGAVAGLLWRLRRLPSRLHAAREADRQLRLSELLASALDVRYSKDPWARSVVSVARQRCADLHPNQVVLHRMGLRAWSGIGISIALAMSIAMLGGEPAKLIAHEGHSLSTPAFDESRSGSHGQPLSPQSDTAAQDEDSTSSRSAQPAAGESAGSPSFDQQVRAGASESRAAAGSGDSGEDGSPAPGGDISEPGGSAGRAGGSMSGQSPSRDVAWLQSSWESDRQQALHEADARRFPDAYQDLVRDYFRR